MIIDGAFFTIGLILLCYGADFLVKGASRLARDLGWSPVIIGLTIVAFGTSTPELVISLISSLKAKSMIAVGNVVGSNICNIALVLGLALIIRPMKSHPSIRRREFPIMLGVSFYLLAICFNDVISRIEGVSLLVGICLYTFLNYRIAVKGAEVNALAIISLDGMPAPAFMASRTGQIVCIVGGIAGVLVGAELLIDAAVSMMSALGVGEKFIGLTVVALGTSLPELATSAVAAYRGEMDISIGNLLGSNVFNILSVLGLAATVSPIPIPGGFVGSGLMVDVLVMVGISALPWVMMGKNDILTRGNGCVLLACYATYLGFLVFRGAV
ncbi:MAG: calcium/sodium antiporter [Pseudomonadota bacterium]